MLLDLETLPPGRRLRTWRAAHGLRLWDIAQAMGCAEARISELERGRRPGTAAEWVKVYAALELLQGAGHGR